jgi:DNA-binding response OmpR family regulator
VAGAGDLVLVVDDDPGFREFVRCLLERAGFVVVLAADALSAFEAVAEREPQLALLDVRLPNVSGYELFRELRDRCGESLPVIFVSGDRTDRYDRIAGMMLGAEDYLVKPVDPDELLVRVRRSLRVRAGARSGSPWMPTERSPISRSASARCSPSSRAATARLESRASS